MGLLGCKLNGKKCPKCGKVHKNVSVIKKRLFKEGKLMIVRRICPKCGNVKAFCNAWYCVCGRKLVPHKGQIMTFSMERNKKISDKKKGKKLTYEHRRKISRSNIGKKKPNLSLALKNSPKAQKLFFKKGCKLNGKVCPVCGKIHKDLRGNNNPSRRMSVRRKISEKLTGKKHPWQEGEKNHTFNNWSSFGEYGKEFNNRIRSTTRMSTDRRCILCGLNERRMGYKLHSHHIDYNKKNNSPDNLVPLCSNCHSRTNTNREKWKEKLMKLKEGKVTREKEDILIIYSGGADSTTLLYYALSLGKKPMVLGFNYNQKHCKELTSAKIICGKLKLTYHIMDLDFSGIKSSLTSKYLSIPKQEDGKQRLTVVPYRNTIFLSCAGAIAEVEGIKEIWFGACKEDFNSYRDCREIFVNSISHTLSLGGTQENSKMLVKVPFIGMSKTEIIKLGITLHVPFEDTWTCYKGGKRPCQQCDSCRERIIAFEQNGIKDPLLEVSK